MRRPVRPTAQSTTISAPVGGLNAIDAGAAMPATDCVQLYNMIPSELGLRARLGYREWCTGLTGASTDAVRSLLPFKGSAASGSGDRLFACTETGIWDVTSSSATPTQKLVFASATGDSGRGVAYAHATSAGHFLFYCDEVNGLHIYTESTDTWAAVTMGAGATQIAGVDPATFRHVTVWKERAFFTRGDTSEAWYLAAGTVYGTATKLDFGRQFRAGGSLVGLWNWTLDGGVGIDNHLVGISSGGDVVIYKGTDPASVSTFGLQGAWYVGGVPAGRLIATDFGGDLLILTTSGVVPLSKLVSGMPLEGGRFVTEKVGPLLNSAMLTRASLNGWSMRMHPEDNTLLITVPESETQATTQLAFALGRPAWARYRDLPIFSSEVLNRKLYFGTVDGRVCINDGYVDNVQLADPNTYTPVQYALLSAFQSLGNGRQKQMQLIRPLFLSESSAPSYEVAARYDYDLSELATVSPGVAAAGSWDVAVWDVDIWQGDYSASQSVRGAAGMGVAVAIALRGTATARTVLTGFDVTFTQGGFL